MSHARPADLNVLPYRPAYVRRRRRLRELRPLLLKGAVVGALVLGAALGFRASAAQTLTGTWASPGRCGVPLATVKVEPMAFSGEDFFCDFSSVARTGDTVRWRGTCTFGADPKEKATVTARLAKGQLSYRINADGWNGPLRRCGT